MLLGGRIPKAFAVVILTPFSSPGEGISFLSHRRMDWTFFPRPPLGVQASLSTAPGKDKR